VTSQLALRQELPDDDQVTGCLPVSWLGVELPFYNNHRLEPSRPDVYFPNPSGLQRGTARVAIDRLPRRSN